METASNLSLSFGWLEATFLSKSKYNGRFPSGHLCHRMCHQLSLCYYLLYVSRIPTVSSVNLWGEGGYSNHMPKLVTGKTIVCDSL